MLFVNELGDLAPTAQRLLFAALDTGSFTRAGRHAAGAAATRA